MFYLIVKNVSLYDLQNLLIPNNTVVMKGGDFNTTEDQFVRVLFEEYSATQEDKRPGKEVSEDQCKLNFPQSIRVHKFKIFNGYSDYASYCFDINLAGSLLGFYLASLNYSSEGLSESAQTSFPPESTERNYEEVLDKDVGNHTMPENESQKTSTLFSRTLPSCNRIPTGVHVQV